MALKASGEGISDRFPAIFWVGIDMGDIDGYTEGCWDGPILMPFLEGAFEEGSIVGRKLFGIAFLASPLIPSYWEGRDDGASVMLS